MKLGKVSLPLIVAIFSSLPPAMHSASQGNRRQELSSSAASVFTDATDKVKLNFVHDPGVVGDYFMPESIGSGGAFLDYDNDGDLDIYLVNGAARNSGNNPSLRDRLFRQEPDGTFVDVTQSAGLLAAGYGMGTAVGDMDNDGDVDLYVTSYGPDALYRNNGDGTFTEVAKVAGINNPHWGCSALFFDYDLDGFLDIYVATYVAYDRSITCNDRAGRPDYCGPAGFLGAPDVLYHNNGDGTFTDVSVSSGIANVFTKGLGVVSADFNDDIYPDLYVANDGQPNHLWVNQGNGTFQDQALVMGVALDELGRAEAGMGVALGDVENDGDLDLFVTNLRGETNTFYRNLGAQGFQDDTLTARLAQSSLPYTGFGTGLFDYDHDGDLDLAVVNGRVTRGPLLVRNTPIGYWDHYAEPDLLFENNGHGVFQDVSKLAGSFGSEIENGRGLAFGDVDNDGDVDLLVTNGGGRARLFRNDAKKTGHWLIIRAIDPSLHRDAIGAKITVFLDGRRLQRVIAPGYSFLTSNDPRAHFGLGSATAIKQIVIRWPDGNDETFPAVKVDQIITLKKGYSKLKGIIEKGIGDRKRH